MRYDEIRIGMLVILCYCLINVKDARVFVISVFGFLEL